VGVVSYLSPSEAVGEARGNVCQSSKEPETKPVLISEAQCSAQVELTALCILQHVFKEKFVLLGIRQDKDFLKNT
jgi:hypothetical protein